MKKKIESVIIACLFLSIHFCMYSQGDGSALTKSNLRPGIQSITIENALDVYQYRTEIVAIVSEDFNLEDPKGVTVKVASGYEAEGELPQNFSQTQELKLKRIMDGTVTTWTLTVKKLTKAATLPFGLKFSSGNSPQNWNNHAGWAYNKIGQIKYTVQLAATGQCLVIASKEAARTLNCTAYASNNKMQGVFDIDASADGVTWNTLASYNEGAPLTRNATDDGVPTPQTERNKSFQLPKGTHYVRFLLKKKMDAAVVINDITISK
jgi:hypothetical protein